MRMGVVIAVTLLTAVLIGGFMAESAFERISVQYVSAAEELRVLTEDGAWQRAGETLAAYRARWTQEERWLRLLLRHSGLLDITMAMDRLGVGIAQQDGSLCALSCAELRQYAVNLRDRETFSWGNLL